MLEGGHKQIGSLKRTPKGARPANFSYASFYSSLLKKPARARAKGVA